MSPDQRECGRYEEKLDDVCRTVSVRSIVSEPLSFSRGGYTLPGTVVRPLTDGDYRGPGVLLIHGSGPNDRDESASGHLGVNYGGTIPLFRLLAQALARKGMVVYRYDKRSCFRENSAGRCPTSVQDYGGSADEIFTSDYVLDAQAALQVLAQQTYVDADDLTVVGHSEGATYVPLLLRDEPKVRAGIQLAGPSESIEKVIVNQLREFADYLAELDSTQHASVITQLRTEADRYAAAFGQILDGTYAEPRFEGATTAQWREWITHTGNLKAEFQSVTKPIFLLNGEFDFNVAPRHLEQFRQWSAEAQMANARFLSLPNVTHAFVTVDAVAKTVDFQFSPAALDAMVTWHRALEPRVE